MKKDGFLLVGLIVSCFLFLRPIPAEARVSILPASFPVQLLQESAQTNGEFIVRVLENRRWREAARLPMNKFCGEQTVTLGGIQSEDGIIQVKISQSGGGGAHLDSVLLNGLGPRELKGSPDPLALKKIFQRDFDLVDVFHKEIELTFHTGGSDARFSLTGRIEPLEISRTPFTFPIENLYKPMSSRSHFLSYRLQTGDKVSPSRGLFERLSASEPFHQAYSPTGSGHPSGMTYFWVDNDTDYLYVAVDFTPDNTRDGDRDYAGVYIRDGGGLKEFRVSEADTRWGRPGFAYTDKVPYQHKVYEFKIPLRELGMPDHREKKELQLAFAAYGTASPPGDYAPAIAYDLANNRYLLVYSKNNVSDFDIYGRFVSDGGLPVGPEIRITNEASSSQGQPAVAFDDAGRRYLLVWLDYRHGGMFPEIYGQRVNAEGTREGADFAIGIIGSPKVFPDLASDSVNQRFLVVWQQMTGINRIYGRIINGDGTPFTNVFQISESAACPCLTPKAAYDPNSQRYLVVWKEDCVGPDVIQGRSILAGGTMPDPAFDIATAGIYARGPGIAFESTHQQFLVIWVSHVSNEIFGSILGAVGNVVKSPFIIASGVSAEWMPDLAYDSKYKRHLVIWERDLDPASRDILGQPVTFDGIPQGSPMVIADRAPTLSGPSVEYNSRCANFLAAYEVREAIQTIGLSLVGGSACLNVYLPLLLRP
jgi:hypothetical protein